MQNEKNPYEVLGINKTASIIKIKKTYRELAKKYHPDKKNGDNQKFIEIKEAYDKVLNPQVQQYFGFFECWDDLIDRDDFWKTKKFRIDGKTEQEREEQLKELFEYQEKLKRNEDYKKAMKLYRWTRNKLKLLGNFYFDLENILRKYGQKYKLDKIDLKVIIRHFERLLNNEIDIKEKITPKPINRNKKFIFNIQNQFHPKFLNKLPMNVLLFIHNKIRDIIPKLQKRVDNKNGKNV